MITKDNKQNRTLSIILPLYNEQEVLLATYKRIKDVADSLTANAIVKSVDILFVNDGSSDNTEKMVLDLAEKDKQVKFISFSRNFGHQKAVSAGINNCDTDLAVIMDADLQDPPELIPDLIKRLDLNDAQCVYCVRKNRQGVSKFNKISYKLFYRILNVLSDTKFPLDTGDFRLIDKNLIDVFKQLPEKDKYVRGLISWSGFKHVPFEYERPARAAGETHYPFSKLVKLALSGLFSFSVKPLTVTVYIGLICITVALLYGLYALFGWIFGYTNANQGWTSLVVLLVFFSGLQLFVMGIMGSYIGKMFNEIKNRPQYVIKEKINL
ncbi:MAG: glycosyltransferase family 2 protein [Bacteroidales bacterium]|jgi:dolichol-phosphate mannosyltransferase|nr:glycosyltransferase family 2 protein [Bacteroidales bacterium]